MMIKIKRVYEPADRSDGRRFLVERLWPRGIRKEALSLAAWCKDASPGTGLRKWFNHDPARWKEFQRRYRVELEARPDAWKPLLDAAKRGTLTLLFSAHDTEHNSAVVLKDYLENRTKTLSTAKKPR